MFVLPANASDDELRNAVRQWFLLVAESRLDDASAFLDLRDAKNCMTVEQFVSRVASMTNGGCVSPPLPIDTDFGLDIADLPLDGPLELVYRSIQGAVTTATFPDCVAEVLYTIPVEGKWSDIDASFYVRESESGLSLELHDIIRLEP